MDIGKYLRGTRERQGLTLRQISTSTKISITTLQCIERNELDRLPGGIFTKGYLRAYAAEVGVNPEEVVHAYVTQSPGDRRDEELQRSPDPLLNNPHEVRDLVTTVLVAILLISILYYWPLRDSAESPASSSHEIASTPEPTEQSAANGATSSTSLPTDRQESGLRLEVEPTGECWVSAKADGRLAIYRLLQSGERVTVTAQEELILRVGDPSTFTYTLNGGPGRSLGETGTPVTVHITEGNREMFLAGSTPEASPKPPPIAGAKPA
jgi:cytoskeletal protein RodZ